MGLPSPANKSALRLHILDVHCVGGPKYKEYTDIKLIHNIEAIIKINNVFECTFCGCTFGVRNYTQKHVKEKHCSTPYKCMNCPEFFQTHGLRDKHTLDCNGGSSQAATFQTVMAFLNQYPMDTSIEDVWKCTKCGGRWTSENSMRGIVI